MTKKIARPWIRTFFVEGQYIETVSELAIYTTVCAIGVYLTFYPVLTNWFTVTQPALAGDARLVNYILEHSFQLLVNKNYVGELWSPPFFYPFKNALAFSENLFGAAPIYWVFRIFEDTSKAFQLWTITVCILNFFSFVLLMRKFQVSPGISAVSAYLFAFGLPRIYALYALHVQLLPQFYTPIAFIFIWSFIRKPAKISLILLLLLTYLQVLAGIYLGWFWLLSLLILFPIVFILDRQFLKRFLNFFQRSFVTLIVSLLSWGTLMYITLAPYLQIKAIVGERPYSEVDTMLPRLVSWFAVPSISVWEPALGWTTRGLPMPWEHTMFPGGLVILLGFLASFITIKYKIRFSSERALLIQICLLVFVGIFCLSLRFPGGVSLWKFVYEFVPGASAIRAVSRIWTVAYLYLFIAVFVCADLLLKQILIRKHLRFVAISFLCIVCFVEQTLKPSGYRVASVEQEMYQVREVIQQGCDIAYLSIVSYPDKTYSPETSPVDQQLKAMWAGLEVNVPVVNGYTGGVPPKYGDPNVAMTMEEIINWLTVVNQVSTNSQGNPKNLCVVFPASTTNLSSLINKYTVKTKSSSSGKYTAFVVPLTPKAFAQIIKVPFPLSTAEPESTLKIPVFVQNISNFSWVPDVNQPVSLSYHWIKADGSFEVFGGNGYRTPLPFSVSPGSAVALNAVVKTPSKPGKYTLRLTMVQEFVTWFEAQGAKPLDIPVTVAESRGSSRLKSSNN